MEEIKFYVVTFNEGLVEGHVLDRKSLLKFQFGNSFVHTNEIWESLDGHTSFIPKVVNKWSNGKLNNFIVR